MKTIPDFSDIFNHPSSLIVTCNVVVFFRSLNNRTLLPLYYAYFLIKRRDNRVA
jgi:hypothetical protein